ncbi:rolling circle replication-associated protein [Thermosporothrix hazakensis]|nr:hypothetical protein KTH_31190 [Thermosporothrix hazakensis]
MKEVTLEQQIQTAEKYGLETLFVCPDTWALRHVWINIETGERQRARCNRWECLYCGPRKVDLWRKLIREAKPVLFLTLTKAGKTVEEAARAFTTFVQALRRGSKGRGRGHIGAREAYPVEYFATLEHHRDRQRVGFHWHVLIVGVDRIPHEVLKELWASATRGRLKGEEAKVKEATIVHIERIRNERSIGYVTKYLMKSLTEGEKGKKVLQKKVKKAVMEATNTPGVYGVQHDEVGAVVVEEVIVEREIVSKARRIRYSRGFFPEQVSELRKRLFAGAAVIEGEQEDEKNEDTESKVWRLEELMQDTEEEELKEYRSKRRAEVLAEADRLRDFDDEAYQGWVNEGFGEVEEELRNMKRALYRQKKRDRLREVIEDMNEGRVFLSGRVITLWHYQRQQMRFVG